MPDEIQNHYKLASDSRLARLSQQGDLDAFEHLVCRYQHRLICFLNFYNSDCQMVEDAAQEAFLQCFLKIDQYDRRYSFQTWLYTIARRFLPRLAATRPSIIPVPELVPESEIGPDTRILTAECRISLWQTVRSVTNGEEFQVIWFRYADRLSIAEIANILDLSQPACKMKLSRLRKRLRPHLSRFLDQGTEPDSLPHPKSRNRAA